MSVTRSGPRPAVLATAIALPVAVAVGLLTWNLARPEEDKPPRVPNAAVTVAPPPTDNPTASAACANLAAELPYRIADLPQRRVTPASEQVVAWGEPAVVFRCAVPAVTPEPMAQIFGVNKVEWVATPGPNGSTIWTSISLPTPVELAIPAKHSEKAAQEILNPLAKLLRKHLANEDD